MWISVDGGIGCGKTTLLNKLSERGFHTLPEPVGAEFGSAGWDDDLKRLYAGVDGALFNFQERVVMERGLDPLVIEFAHDEHVRIIERCPSIQLETFVKAGDFKPNELAEIEKLYSITLDLWRPKKHIYLRASPQRSFERMMGRGRAAERDVTLRYHQQLFDLHEKAFENLKGAGQSVVVLDTDEMDPSQVLSAVLDVLGDLI